MESYDIECYLNRMGFPIEQYASQEEACEAAWEGLIEDGEVQSDDENSYYHLESVIEDMWEKHCDELARKREERVTTGVPELDEALSGGVPVASIVGDGQAQVTSEDAQELALEQAEARIAELEDALFQADGEHARAMLDPESHLRLVNVNGAGPLYREGKLVSCLSGHKAVPDFELLSGAHEARKQAKRLLEAAENMERLARQG